MAAQLDLGFHLSEATRDERNQNGLNPMQTPDVVDDDDSWEVRAFAEDTTNAMGTTWPPRSYTCTYCRREFKSAQALGGHMNVHRRDRARLHQTPPNAFKPSSSSTSNSFIIPTPDFSGGGLCLLYQFPNPNTNHGGIIGINNNNSPSNSNVNAYIHSVSPSSFFSMSNHSLNNFMPSTSPSTAIPMNDHRAGPSSTNFSQCFGDEQQEVDLELRLGHGPSTTQTHKISNLEAAACLRKRSN